MRFPCLVLDHDDTVVNSTAVIHFPSFLAYLAQVRPGLSYTLDDYFRKNFDPGIIPLFKDELGFTDEELEGEYQFWQNWVATRVPEAYPGMREILERYKARGGKIAVVSHSVSDVIRRDYRENGLPEPDLIFGWELPPEHRKPHVWPLEQIMAEFQLAPDQLLMLDDLKPGYDMCRAAGVPVRGGGLGQRHPGDRGLYAPELRLLFQDRRPPSATFWSSNKKSRIPSWGCGFVIAPIRQPAQSYPCFPSCRSAALRRGSAADP